MSSKSSVLANVLAIIATLGLSACAGNTAPQEDIVDPRNFVIKTVDQNNKPLPAKRVSWWYTGNPDEPRELQCEQDACTEWVMKEAISGPITISARASRVKEDDSQCWDWFGGETNATVNPGVPQQITMMLVYRATACT